MRTHGKKYTAAKGQVENRPYDLKDALPLVQKIKFAKFDETVALSIRLGVDPKWLRAELKAGRLPGVEAGKTALFDAELVERLLAERARQASADVGGAEEAP